MSNHLLSTTSSRPANTMVANNAARRVAMLESDTEGGTKFDDLLPGRKTGEAKAKGDDSPDRSARLKQWRRAEEDADATEAQPSNDAAGQGQPMQTASVQQAVLAASATPIADADEAATENTITDGGTAGGEPANTVSDPIKSPVPPLFGSPMPGGDPGDDDPSMPTGGIKAPMIEPHGPPIPVADDPGAGAVGANDKFPAIRVPDPGHSPANIRKAATGVDASQQLPPVNDSASSATDSSVRSADTSAANTLTGAHTNMVPTPINATSLPNTPMSLNGMLKGEYTTTIPAPPNPPANSLASNVATTANMFPITTAAQAQLATTVATTPALGTEPVSVSGSGAANLADRVGRASVKATASKEGDSSQDADNEGIVSTPAVIGTATAKGHANVTANPSNSGADAERDTSSQQDKDASAVFGLPDARDGESPTSQAKDGDAVKASATTASVAPTLFAATAQTPAIDTVNAAAPSTGIVRVDKVETLLQTVQETAQKVQLDGSSQVELRVRLEGVADDVMVRVHLDENKQVQVDFQTGSTELRSVLEQGWNDLMASSTATLSNASLNVPDFTAARTASPTPSAETMSYPPETYRESRRFSNAPASNNGQPSRRWSGYA